MVKQLRLKNVCRNIANDLISHKNITEDQILAFMDEFALENPEKFSEMPEDYRRLSLRVGEMWQYQEWRDMTVEQAFLCGSLWGSIKAYEFRCRKSRNETQMKSFESKYKDRYWLFQTIKSQPGILHKDLARENNISNSCLSQIMSDENMGNLISYRISGREKCYYLKPQGEELLKRLKVKERKILSNHSEILKAIDTNNSPYISGHEWKTKWKSVFTSVPVAALSSMAANQLSERSKTIYNGEVVVGEVIGVNEWEPIQIYRNVQKDENLKSGLEVYSVR